MAAKGERLDQLCVLRGLFPSRRQAQAAILAGRVRAGGRIETKAGTRYPEDVEIELVAPVLPYVSRGGLKLERALDAFGIDVEGWVALDVGASTGGFTDCLLQRGASRVYAVDVGNGQLAWKLRQDPRVVVLEGTNARYLSRDAVPEPPGIAVIDVAFISLSKVLPAVLEVLAPGAPVIALIKPQFEAGPERVGKKGVVRDPRVHAEVLTRVLQEAIALGCRPEGLIPSPIRGAEGNLEFLALWHAPSAEERRRLLAHPWPEPLPLDAEWRRRVEAVVREAHGQGGD